MSDWNGLLVIDKPSGITSRDAVDRAQSWFPSKTRIGHTGTLDPLATGVLVLCIGAATRLTEYVQRMPKVYRAGITLGATSDTDDADGTISPLSLGEGSGVRASPPSRDQIELALSPFIGPIDQTPPAYSAAKVTGRRAYSLARKGQTPDLQPRRVSIQRIDILDYAYPHLDIVVRCGKGTYIRSLARDLGRALGCGGYISALRRLEVGWFTEADALPLDGDAEQARPRLLPMWRAVQDWEPITLMPEITEKLRQGQRVAPPYGAYDDHFEFAVLDTFGRTFAIVEIVDSWMLPRKVLAGHQPDA